MGIKRNDEVEQVLPSPIKGKVSGFSVDQESGDKLVHVVTEDGAGFFFKEEQLKVTKAFQPEEAPQKEESEA